MSLKKVYIYFPLILIFLGYSLFAKENSNSSRAIWFITQDSTQSTSEYKYYTRVIQYLSKKEGFHFLKSSFKPNNFNILEKIDDLIPENDSSGVEVEIYAFLKDHDPILIDYLNDLKKRIWGRLNKKYKTNKKEFYLYIEDSSFISRMKINFFNNLESIASMEEMTRNILRSIKFISSTTIDYSTENYSFDLNPLKVNSIIEKECISKVKNDQMPISSKKQKNGLIMKVPSKRNFKPLMLKNNSEFYCLIEASNKGDKKNPNSLLLYHFIYPKPFFYVEPQEIEMRYDRKGGVIESSFEISSDFILKKAHIFIKPKKVKGKYPQFFSMHRKWSWSSAKNSFFLNDIYGRTQKYHFSKDPKIIKLALKGRPMDQFTGSVQIWQKNTKIRSLNIHIDQYHLTGYILDQLVMNKFKLISFLILFGLILFLIRGSVLKNTIYICKSILLKLKRKKKETLSKGELTCVLKEPKKLYFSAMNNPFDYHLPFIKKAFTVYFKVDGSIDIAHRGKNINLNEKEGNFTYSITEDSELTFTEEEFKEKFNIIRVILVKIKKWDHQHTEEIPSSNEQIKIKSETQID